MARYLSPAWFDAMRSRLDASAPAASDERLCVQQVVTGGPDGDVSYVISVGPDGFRLTAGSTDAPDLTIIEDYETAAAVHRGELSAAAALSGGRIKVTGRTDLLVARASALQGLDEVLTTDDPSTTTYD